MKIAVIEDQKPLSDQLVAWLRKGFPGAQIDPWFTRDEAKAAVAREAYDLITLDIELGAERNAGVAIIKEATRTRTVPVLVVSGLPAEFYRGVMKELEAWDYLQRPVEEHDFIGTALNIIRVAHAQKKPEEPSLRLDPLSSVRPSWKGQRLNIPAAAQRILHVVYKKRDCADPTATYQELYAAVLSGKNPSNIRQQVAKINEAFREIDPEVKYRLVNEPMRGYRWSKQ